MTTLLDKARARRNGREGKSKPEAVTSSGPHLTDMGNAQRFVCDHAADVRYVHPWKKWLVWDGTRWKIDDTGEVARFAKTTVKKMYDDAAVMLERLKGEDDGGGKSGICKALKAIIIHARKSEDARALNRMLELARSEEGVPVLPDDLDSHPWLFNCPNGTIDLRTGDLRPHKREDFLTQFCPTEYKPGAPCPRFIKTLATIFNDDADMVEFNRRHLGYSLTGDVSEQALPIWHGAGSNGKSTIITAVLETIGTDYAGTVPVELLMETRGTQHPTILADLFGKRLMVAAETAEGGRINESRLKFLTGGDRIKARRMNENFWEFHPSHKLILITNHKPEVRGTDHAFWRRLRLVPFEVQFLNPKAPENTGKVIPENRRIDPKLSEALRAEREGILAWLVRGCISWQRDGLTVPQAVAKATADYRSTQDVIASFIGECCLESPGVRCRFSALFEAYCKWADAAREKPLTRKAMGESLAAKGFTRHESSGTWYIGLTLRESGDSGDC
jgi:putative DNA primase/helicase